MNKWTRSLSSIGCKLFSIILSLILTCLSIILLIYHKQIVWYYIIFSIIVTIFCIFASFIICNRKIVLDKQNKLIKIYNLKCLTLSINDIFQIRVDTNNSINPKLYCFVIINLKNGNNIKFPEFFALIKSNAVEKTKLIINDLNEQLGTI